MFLSLSYRQLLSNISGHVLTCNYAKKKKCFIIFCIKLTIYIKNQIFKKNSFKNSFHLTSLLYLNRETPWKRFIQKRKIAIFFQLEIFVHKTTFNFHSFNKVNDFVTSQYNTAIFYPFYLKP